MNFLALHIAPIAEIRQTANTAHMATLQANGHWGNILGAPGGFSFLCRPSIFRFGSFEHPRPPTVDNARLKNTEWREAAESGLRARTCRGFPGCWIPRGFQLWGELPGARMRHPKMASE